MKNEIDIRVTLSGPLAQQFRTYVENKHKGVKGAYSFTIRQALAEFLNREGINKNLTK